MAVVRQGGRVGGAGEEKWTCSGGIGGGSWGVLGDLGVPVVRLVEGLGGVAGYRLSVCESVMCGGRSRCRGGHRSWQGILCWRVVGAVRWADLGRVGAGWGGGGVGW